VSLASRNAAIIILPVFVVSRWLSEAWTNNSSHLKSGDAETNSKHLGWASPSKQLPRPVQLVSFLMPVCVEFCSELSREHLVWAPLQGIQLSDAVDGIAGLDCGRRSS